jgi:hypothetical protein
MTFTKFQPISRDPFSSYLPGKVYIVIVMAALAEELLALLVISSLLGTPVSAIETAVSLRSSRINPTTRITRMIRTNNLLTYIAS